MKVINLKGGLGNQMFQYAFFLANLELNKNVKLDVSNFKYYYNHNGLELHKVFGIEITNDVDRTLTHCLKDNGLLFNFRKWIGLFLFDKNFLVKKTHYIEKNYSDFDSELFKKSNRYLDGYWQNEKYFSHIQHKILNKYKWNSVSQKNEIISSKMVNENSISIHIRRLDKIKSVKDLFYILRLKMTYRVAPKSYYIKAIELIKTKVDSPKFYLFTNDIKWVKNSIIGNTNFVFVDWNRGNESNEDMFLMTKCKHNIISTSTFSWWGAWLNKNQNKIVISPKKWASRLEADKGIIPDSWIRI